MKRIGQLMEMIAAPDNLRLAFWKAARSKRGKQDCQRFQDRLDTNLESLRDELLSGQVPVGDYHYFTIHDPNVVSQKVAVNGSGQMSITCANSWTTTL